MFDRDKPKQTTLYVHYCNNKVVSVKIEVNTSIRTVECTIHFFLNGARECGY